MPQFDVHRLRSGDGLVVDCQADTIGQYERRLVIPQLPTKNVPTALPRLTPTFTLEGQRYTLATPLAASVSQHDLGKRISSLAIERDRIVAAIDVLITGI